MPDVIYNLKLIISMMENEVLKAIKERRSIRRYKADQITDEELKTVLEAGTWAATGHGSQEPFIIAVQNPDTCAQLRKMNAEAMGVESDPYYGAPTIVIVLAREDDPNNIKDGSLILGNMMLAAHSIGLSSCWINREDVMFASEQGKQLMQPAVRTGTLFLSFAPPRGLASLCLTPL